MRSNSPLPASARIALGVSLAVLVILIFAPLFPILSEFSFESLRATLLDARQLGLLGNSLFVSLGSALFALVWGIPFAFLVTRAQIPGHRTWQAIGLLPLLLPPLIGGIGWSALVPLQGRLGAVWILSLAYFPLVWILVAHALERVDRRQEEAARIFGGRSALFGLWSRQMFPAAAIGALLVALFALAEFSLPDYLSALGTPCGVYAEEIFLRWGQGGRDGEALALSLPPLLLLGVALWLIAKLARRMPQDLGARFVPPQRVALGRWRWPATFFPLALLSAAVAIPLGKLAIDAGGPASYLEAFRAARGDLGNSLLVAASVAVLAAALSLFPAFFAARAPSRFGFSAAALFPLALPGLVLAIGSIRLWNRPGPVLDWSDWIYGTKAIVIFLLLTKYSALSFLASSEGFRRTSLAADRSAAVAGIPFWGRLRWITLPLAFPTLLAGMALVFLFSMREIDTLALIPSANSMAMFRIYNYLHFGRDSLLAAMCLLTVFCSVVPVWILWLRFSREKSA